MATNEKLLIETLHDGLGIDVVEGFKKLVSSQFGGNPGKGFGELIQNFIDSYPSFVPIEERRGAITTGEKMISMTDFGSGLSLEKIKLLLTLGGTDKDQDPSKIGKFGIGFYAMLNPRLKTNKIEVITRCEGQVVKIIMEIPDPEKLPVLKLTVLDISINFSTRIQVWFDTDESVDKCLSYAKEVLEYYPCKVTIDDLPFLSVWGHAEKDGTRIFSAGSQKGFLKKTYYKPVVKVLCQYEYITELTVSSFAKGGYSLSYDLKDYLQDQMPYLADYDAVINNDRLALTLSRDSFYLNSQFTEMVTLLRKMLMSKVYEQLSNQRLDNQDILANLYILKDRIRNHFQNAPKEKKDYTTEELVIDLLIKSKIFPVADTLEMYSIADIKKALTPTVPLFYSENKMNVQWLGGSFVHDFILLPPKCIVCFGAKFFYDELLRTLFKDIVDLDSIQQDQNKISELIKRRIVDKSAITPRCRLIGDLMLTPVQKGMLRNINYILGHEEIKNVISENINIPVKSITAAFFTVEEEGAYISTGLFNTDGIPLSSEVVSNFESESGEESQNNLPKDLFLGLRMDHPLINSLLGSNNEYKAYYTMTYIANELTRCQKILIPYSPWYHLIKEKLAGEMRVAMMNQMLS